MSDLYQWIFYPKYLHLVLSRCTNNQIKSLKLIGCVSNQSFCLLLAFAGSICQIFSKGYFSLSKTWLEHLCATFFKTKISPSNRIWTSDLWISALFHTTVHRSTNWAIEGTYLNHVQTYRGLYYQLSYRGYVLEPCSKLQRTVRMAEWSKALRSGRSPLLWAWVRIPLLTKYFYFGSLQNRFGLKVYNL